MRFWRLEPIEVVDPKLQDGTGAEVEDVASITDGKLVFNAKVQNNTYSADKDITILTAVYHDDTLYSVNSKTTKIAQGTAYTVDDQFTLPTGALSGKWTAAMYIWDMNTLTPLTETSY